jgi:polyphosphate kinase 2 (PPK2 family)
MCSRCGSRASCRRRSGSGGRYDHIVAFERLLADEGTTIVKVLLHLSKEEQEERLEARRARPEKRWKLNPEDLRTRERWDEYQAAFEDAIERTGTLQAPWHVVPADKKWYARWAVATVLVATLEAMDLRWPE